MDVFLLPCLFLIISFDQNSSISVPDLVCIILRITNSAGLTGAIPINTIRRPLSISSWVIVVRSHLTKNACSGAVPISAPSLHTLVRNEAMVAMTLDQSLSLLGSNTVHRVPSSIDSSRNKNRRLTLTYFHTE